MLIILILIITTIKRYIMNSTKVILKNVRFSYVYVFTKDNNDKYSCSLLIDKNDPQVEELKAAIQAAVSQGAAVLGPGFKLDVSKVLHDGDEKDDPNYRGHWYLNAKSKNKPGVVKKNSSGMGGKTTDITDESEFYSGCYGAASVNFFAFNQGVNKGISCGLNNVLKLGDGPFLGGRSSAESDLGDLCADDAIC